MSTLMATAFSLLGGVVTKRLMWEQLISAALLAHNECRLLRYRTGACLQFEDGLCESPNALVPLHCVARRVGSDQPSADCK